MRTLLLTALLTACWAAAGCAGGFRVGGNRFGAGVGGYIGPVPDAVKPERTSHHPSDVEQSTLPR